VLIWREVVQMEITFNGVSLRELALVHVLVVVAVVVMLAQLEYLYCHFD